MRKRIKWYSFGGARANERGERMKRTGNRVSVREGYRKPKKRSTSTYRKRKR